MIVKRNVARKEKRGNEPTKSIKRKMEKMRIEKINMSEVERCK